MPISRATWMGSLVALAAIVPLDCFHAIPEKSSPAPEKSVESSSELRAREVSDADRNDPPEKSAEPADMAKPVEPPWRTAHRIETERIQRERRTQAYASWQITLRTDSEKIVPCQPLYLTIKVTNTTDQARKLRELFSFCEFWILVGKGGEQPRVVKKTSSERDNEDANLLVINKETLVEGRASVFFDEMLTVEKIDGGWSQNADGSWSRRHDAKRIFSEPGEYKVYAAVVDPHDRFEVLRSEMLVVTVRVPTESEAPYVEFFREGRQIPPHYGFNKVDEEAFDKVRGQGLRTAAFERKLNREAIDKLREILVKHPDPPVADDMRQYLMIKLIGSAKRRDARGRDLGYDREVLAAAAQVYLDIAPERKQLRRRGINTWGDLSTRFDLDHSQPILQILASWKASSPFYEDEVESQAALDEIIAKIEAPLAQEARQKAAAPPPRPKVPTD